MSGAGASACQPASSTESVHFLGSVATGCLFSIKNRKSSRLTNECSKPRDRNGFFRLPNAAGGNVLFRIFRLKSSHAIFLSLLASTAFSQDTTGTIAGTVTDAQDALVPGAVLTLANLEQGVARKAASNPQGLYEFKFLEPGRYEVTASQPGFQQLVKTDLVLDRRPDDARRLPSRTGRRDSNPYPSATPDRRC